MRRYTRRGRRGIVRGDRGQALVEFAFASIVFFMTLFGMISFGLAVWQYNFVADLAQEGARWASVRGASSAVCQFCPASAANVQTYVTSRALGMTVPTTVTSINAATKACTATSVNPSSLNPGTGFCVTVTRTFKPFTSFIPNATLTLQSTAQMIISR